MKPLNKCAIKNLPYYDVFFITIYGKQNNKISYEKKKVTSITKFRSLGHGNLYFSRKLLK